MKYPLMKNNILKNDIVTLTKFLNSNKKLILTNSKQVIKFEKLWSKWLGVKHSVFVNSGSSANLLSIQILKILNHKGGNVIIPGFTWSSDVASVIHCGFNPKFVDVNLENLAMNEEEVFKAVDKNTKAIFLTHAQGYNGLSNKILSLCKKKKIMLIEDVCESHGAKFKKKKLGTFGRISNFSFYYAHHMSTIEGGMICTNDEKIYEMARSLRSHGMLREIKSKTYQKKIIKKYKDLNSQFIFLYPAYNVRSTEINAVIGINQIKRLDNNIKKRNINCRLFNSLIDKKVFFTDFDMEGMSNYAFNLILRKENNSLLKKLVKALTKKGIEFRMGSAGGGNQLRQPYVRNLKLKIRPESLKNTDHIHKYGMYIGNYPELKSKDIRYICKIINESVK